MKEKPTFSQGIPLAGLKRGGRFFFFFQKFRWLIYEGAEYVILYKLAWMTTGSSVEGYLKWHQRTLARPKSLSYRKTIVRIPPFNPSASSFTKILPSVHREFKGPPKGSDSWKIDHSEGCRPDNAYTSLGQWKYKPEYYFPQIIRL